MFIKTARECPILSTVSQTTASNVSASGFGCNEEDAGCEGAGAAAAPAAAASVASTEHRGIHLRLQCHRVALKHYQPVCFNEESSNKKSCCNSTPLQEYLSHEPAPAWELFLLT